MNNQVDQAVKVLNDGGIIIFPTDTAFGIGCLINNEKSIKRLFEIRKRPQTQATPVLVNSIEMAKEYVEVMPQEVINKLINPFWPGALTIILKSKNDKVPSLVRGGKDTIGFRIPNHEDALSIIEKAGFPLLGPSANFHSEQTPYVYKDLNPELIKQVDFVVNGECSLKKASTVIDCSVNPWKILRNGALEVKI